jgi:hypothetical protein
MTLHACARRPWEHACPQADASQQLPDFVALSDEPQLASVALLLAAAKVVAHSLPAHHGVGRRLADELCNDPDCVIAVLAHLIADRCVELSELIAAYQLAIHSHRPDDQVEFPF